jgi:hypothetical protein
LTIMIDFYPRTRLSAFIEMKLKTGFNSG